MIFFFSWFFSKKKRVSNLLYLMKKRYYNSAVKRSVDLFFLIFGTDLLNCSSFLFNSFIDLYLSKSFSPVMAHKNWESRLDMIYSKMNHLCHKADKLIQSFEIAIKLLSSKGENSNLRSSKRDFCFCCKEKGHYVKKCPQLTQIASPKGQGSA